MIPSDRQMYPRLGNLDQVHVEGPLQKMQEHEMVREKQTVDLAAVLPPRKFYTEESFVLVSMNNLGS